MLYYRKIKIILNYFAFFSDLGVTFCGFLVLRIARNNKESLTY